VPGRTLADLIQPHTVSTNAARPQLGIDETIAIARQIALALEAAHDAGIVHRDLKPANIKVTDDDVVKVLDFGLARAAAADGAEDTAATVTSPAMTQAGVILGTAAYMAPEQARGKPVDKRADIWAFGVVIYEMLTGQRLFDGETVTDVIAQVLTRPIDLTALPANTPTRVRELVARCLERDPKRRLRDIGEARIALSDPATSIAGTVTISATLPGVMAQSRVKRATWMLWLPWVLATGLLIAVVALGIDRGRAWRSRTPDSSKPFVLEISPPPGGEFLIASNAGSIIIAPDASKVVFLSITSGGLKLFVRSLATGETHAIAGAVDPGYPFWSPDSRKIAYFGNTKLYTVDLAGGLPEPIADIQQGRGGTWTDAGDILFTPVGGGTLHRVSERGGTITEITKLDPARGENAHYWPVALPGGKKFLFFVRSRVLENNGIYLGAVDGSTKPVRVVSSLSSGLYSRPHGGIPGRLLWVRDGNLLAQAMDSESGALSGEVTTLATDVRVEESQRGTFADVASDGTIAWASAKAAEYQLLAVDRDGRRVMGLPIPAGKLVQPRISPDDRQLLFTRASNGTADIFDYDFATKEVRPLTTDPDYDENGVWSPDSRDVFYQGNRGGDQVTLIQALDNSKPEQVITHGADKDTGTYGRDGRSVIISRGTRDLALIRLSDPSTEIQLTPDPGLELEPALSPDGRWLAFVSDRSGHSEVVLASFQDDGTTVRLGSERVPVSSGGGVDPHWRKDGKEIIYAGADAQLRAVSVTITGNAVSIGRPTALPIIPMNVGGSGSNWTANSTHTLFVIVEAPLASHQTFRVMLGK